MNKIGSVLIFALLLNSNGRGPTAVFGQEFGATYANEQSELHLWVNVDTSGSLLTTELIATVSRLWAELPSISAAIGVTRISWSQFGADGGRPAILFDISLPPVVSATTVPSSNTNEFSDLRNFRQAMYADSVETAKTARESFYRTYREIFVQRISPESTSVFGSLGNRLTSPCSDISGMLWHAALHDGDGYYIEIDITDGAENCRAAIVPPPRHNAHVALVIILVPEDPAVPGATEVAKKKSWEQFEIRKSELKRAVPWAHIISFDNENLTKILRESIAQQ